MNKIKCYLSIMASTLNLFALDRDFPASRQLQVVVEANPNNNNKKENRLLVTDNVSSALLTSINTDTDEIKSAANAILTFLQNAGPGGSTGGSTGGTTGGTIIGNSTLVPVTKVYQNQNIFDGTNNIPKSKLVNVFLIDKINIYYKDQNSTDDHSIRVMGVLDVDGLVDSNDVIFSDYPTNATTIENTSVELYRFFPKQNSEAGNANTFNVIDLNVNGIAYIYLDTSSITDNNVSRTAFVSAQYVTLTDTNTTGEPDAITSLNVAYQLTNHFLGRSFNLIANNVQVGTTGGLLFTFMNNATTSPTSTDDYKVIKINKIVVVNNTSSDVIENRLDIVINIGSAPNITTVPLPSLPSNFNLYSTTGDGTNDISMLCVNDGTSTINPTETPTPFAKLAINTNELTKEIIFNDMSFFLKPGSLITVVGTSTVNTNSTINVYYTEFSGTDISAVIPNPITTP